MENHHFQWVIYYKWAIFNSYVKLPEAKIPAHPFLQNIPAVIPLIRVHPASTPWRPRSSSRSASAKRQRRDWKRSIWKKRVVLPKIWEKLKMQRWCKQKKNDTAVFKVKSRGVTSGAVSLAIILEKGRIPPCIPSIPWADYLHLMSWNAHLLLHQSKYCSWHTWVWMMEMRLRSFDHSAYQPSKQTINIDHRADS